MDSFSLIANSGIQLLTFRLKLNTQDKFKMWFREWYDTSNGQWRLDLAHEVTTDDNVFVLRQARIIRWRLSERPNNRIRSYRIAK